MNIPYTVIDRQQWHRRAIFEFFSTYQNPFFSITAQVRAGDFYYFCKKRNFPFSLALVYASNKSAERVAAFRQRVAGNEIREYHYLDAGLTKLRDDGSFYFSHLSRQPSLEQFVAQKAYFHTPAANFDENGDVMSMIHYSILPWIAFQSMQHAYRDAQDTVPKIAFGKLHSNTADAAVLCLPVSVQLHHSLADGLHVAQYFEEFEKIMSEIATN